MVMAGVRVNHALCPDQMMFFLTHWSRETRKRVIGKQYSPQNAASDLGSPLFANSFAIFL